MWSRGQVYRYAEQNQVVKWLDVLSLLSERGQTGKSLAEKGVWNGNMLAFVTSH